jgi:predicted ATPase
MLPLARLEQRNVEKLIGLVAGGRRLPAAVLDPIMAKADGIPLFAEELTKTVLESGLLTRAGDDYVLEGPLPSLAIPSTLHDSLMARLDRLGAIKEIAQVGAALGRRFSFAMLAAVTGQTGGQLPDALASLVGAELVLARGEPPEAEYTFKHALVQDAAYESLLRARRKSLHVRIAEVIETGFSQIVETEPEVLAHHWTRADVAHKAAEYWLKAGQRAVARSANVEAIRHLTNGIELLAGIPQGRIRGLLEFNLHLSLGQASYVVKGPAAAETIAAYSRAQELVEEVGDPEQRCFVLYGIFSGYHFASRFELARHPAQRVLELATRDGDTGHMCQAHRMLGYICFFRGDSKGALGHFHELARLYDTEKHARLAFRYGADCLAASRGFQILIDCASGLPESALRMAQENLAYAHTLGHPATIGWVFASVGYLHFYVRDHRAAHQVTAEGIRFCEENNIGAWALHCRVFNVWARAHLESPLHCAAEIRRAIAAAGTGTALGRPLLRGVLAEVLMADGNPGEAIKETDAALGEIASTGQHFFEPTVWEIRGRCLLRLSPASEAEAEASFKRSMGAANAMDAALLALRAATHLAKLASKRGRAPEFQDAVQSLYSRFTEGFEMTDLVAARAVLGRSEASR